MELNKNNIINETIESENNTGLFIHENGYTWNERLEFISNPTEDLAEYLGNYCKALIKRANLYKEDNRYDRAETKMTLKINGNVFSSDNEADFINALGELSKAPFTLDIEFSGHAHNTIVRIIEATGEDETAPTEVTADDFGWSGFALFPILKEKKDQCNFNYILIFEADVDGSVSTCEIKNGVAKCGEEMFTRDILPEDFGGEFAYIDGAATIGVYPAKVPELDKSLENLITKYLSDEEREHFNNYFWNEWEEGNFIEAFPNFKDIKQAVEFVSELNSVVESVAEYNPELSCSDNTVWFNKENFSILRMMADKGKFYLLGAKF